MKVKNLDKESCFYGCIGTIIKEDGSDPPICLVKYTEKLGSWTSSRKLKRNMKDTDGHSFKSPKEIVDEILGLPLSLDGEPYIYDIEKIVGIGMLSSLNVWIIKELVKRIKGGEK